MTAEFGFTFAEIKKKHTRENITKSIANSIITILFICSIANGIAILFLSLNISRKGPVAATNMLHNTPLITVYKCNTNMKYLNILKNAKVQMNTNIHLKQSIAIFIAVLFISIVNNPAAL